MALQDSVEELLRAWCDRGLESQAAYRGDWAPATGKAGMLAEVRLAPALVLRKRDQGALIAYYDQMIESLTAQDAQAPLGLAQLVQPLEAAERMAFLAERDGAGTDALGRDPLFPLPANPEQRLIMTRLGGDNGVVVQGPPGTGKTHSIANLLSALLAQGQRVLVTSQKAQALRVLRDKLPDEIAGLCVSMTDLGRGGSAELEGGVKALSARFSSYDPGRQAQRIAAKSQELHSARRTTAELAERVRALRESETYSHPEIAPGYRGTLAEMARRLGREEPDCLWMPVPMPAAAPATPPITVGEAAELVELLAGETPQRRARPGQRIPDVGTLPTAEQVKALIADEAAAQSLARQAQNQISARLSHLDPKLVARLKKIATDVAADLHHLALPDDATAWDPADWSVLALSDMLANRNLPLWQQVEAYAGRLSALEETTRRIALREVVHPPLDGPAAAAAYVQAMRGLRDHFAAGNRLKQGLFRPAVQKAAEPFLAAVSVDGVSPTNAELLSIVLDDLEGRQIADQLRRCWRHVGVEFPPDQPLVVTQSQLRDAFATLAVVRRVSEAVSDTVRLLAAANVHLGLRTPAEWLSYASALHAVRLRLDAERATMRLEELYSALDHQVRLGSPAPELSEAVQAVAARDGVTYQLCLAALANAHRELADQRRCDELAARVRAAHPALLTLLTEAGTWQPRFPVWERAWAWAKTQTFFTEQRQPGLEQRLEAELDAATTREMRLTGELAAEQAWDAALGRMDSRQTTALRAYQDHMSKIGKGTGRYAPVTRRSPGRPWQTPATPYRPGSCRSSRCWRRSRRSATPSTSSSWTKPARRASRRCSCCGWLPASSWWATTSSVPPPRSAMASWSPSSRSWPPTCRACPPTCGTPSPPSRASSTCCGRASAGSYG